MEPQSMRGEATRVDDIDATRLDWITIPRAKFLAASVLLLLTFRGYDSGILVRGGGRWRGGESKGGNSRGVRCFGGQHGGAFDTGGGGAEADHDILFPRCAADIRQTCRVVLLLRGFQRVIRPDRITASIIRESWYARDIPPDEEGLMNPPFSLFFFFFIFSFR